MDWTNLGGLAWLLAGGAIFYLMMRRGGCGMGGHGAHGHQHEDGGAADVPRPPERGAVGEHDPVCGMPIDPARAAGTREVMGRTFYLCSKDCLEKFDRDPTSYAHRLMGATPPAATASAQQAQSHRHRGC